MANDKGSLHYSTTVGDSRPFLIAGAIALIAAVPGYAATAAALRDTTVRYDPGLKDRAQASLRGVITLGPEPFRGTPEAVRVGLAGTLVHEHVHTHQNPFLKTWSFWAGVLTRTHPMRRYERPAYRRQADFLDALAAAQPTLRAQAIQERAAVLGAFAASYGPF